jgi:peptidoglycan/xylan/chitin deacetylase (PgdA/CDA1 family)
MRPRGSAPGFGSEHGFGPERRSGALALTFDNLGEASELERGTLPAGAPRGRHPSVTEALPRLLTELDRLELRATFFVEAINCELYPAALGEIAGRGHELAMHGWRHEPWSGLEPERERELLQRGVGAFAALGEPVRGFRPPGGELTGASPALLREAGITWCSPAGGRAGAHDGLVRVPFEWQLVDAYHLMDRFTADPLAPEAAAELIARELDALAPAGRFATLVLHPFLMLDRAWWAGTLELLARVRALQDQVWVVPAGRVAGWLDEAA